MLNHTSKDRGGEVTVGQAPVVGTAIPPLLSELKSAATDEVAVVDLKGSQIRAALERSVSLYPSTSMSFLQLSGIDAAFSKSAPADKRIVSASVNGAKLEDGRTYSVAMPVSLARGGYGYFKIWEKTQLTRTLNGVTLESLLKGKKASDTSPRWTAQN